MIRFVDRATKEIVKELEEHSGFFSVPCIDETIIFGAVRYQVASVVHEPDKEIITINGIRKPWRQPRKS